VALAYHFVGRLIRMTKVGTTLVEISTHPLYCGQTYDVFILQSGRCSIRTFEALLVCDEEAVYLQGTDTRIASQRVFQQPLLKRHSFHVRPGTPFESTCALHVPAGAMHSFKSDHNEVKWKLLVRADMEGYADYERSFPMIVHPGSEPSV